MLDQKIHVLGEEDIVIMLGLLGIEGTVIEDRASFLDKFKELKKNPSIGMIIIGSELSTADYDFLLNFKLNNRIPLVFILPDMFRPDIDREDVMKRKIFEAIGDIISY